MAIYLSKTQFTLTIFKAQFSLATSKPNSYWQHQNPILIRNIKTQFLLGLLYQKEKKPKIINAWQRKNIMVKCYRGKKGPWQSSYEKKIIESYLEDYVLIL